MGSRWVDEADFNLDFAANYDVLIFGRGSDMLAFGEGDGGLFVMPTIIEGHCAANAATRQFDLGV